MGQYVDGTKNPATLMPESWWIDFELMQQPGNIDYQLDIFYDYQTNVAQYPQYQEYLRKTQVPLLAAWGKNDVMYEANLHAVLDLKVNFLRLDLSHPAQRLLNAISPMLKSISSMLVISRSKVTCSK